MRQGDMSHRAWHDGMTMGAHHHLRGCDGVAASPVNHQPALGVVKAVQVHRLLLVVGKDLQKKGGLVQKELGVKATSQKIPKKKRKKEKKKTETLDDRVRGIKSIDLRNAIIGATILRVRLSMCIARNTHATSFIVSYAAGPLHCMSHAPSRVGATHVAGGIAALPRDACVHARVRACVHARVRVCVRVRGVGACACVRVGCGGVSVVVQRGRLASPIIPTDVGDGFVCWGGVHGVGTHVNMR